MAVDGAACKDRGCDPQALRFHSDPRKALTWISPRAY
jgi:hypothetical protein